MRYPLALLVSVLLPAAGAAQTMPVPDPANPRLQTFRWEPGSEVQLTALPMTGLTVMLEPGETISEVALDRRGDFEVRVSSERNSFLLLPLVADASASLSVRTDGREYRFRAMTGTGLMAAYLVRHASGSSYAGVSPAQPAFVPQEAVPAGPPAVYRLRGDRSVRPASITDDGRKTMIRFDEEQALPAVFAIGPTGEEQAVNGHMRGDVFEIDRVWEELVFRIDRERATARRVMPGEPR